jgi:hypothetical protein
MLAGIVSQRFCKFNGVNRFFIHIDNHLYVILIDIYLYVNSETPILNILFIRWVLVWYLLT